MTPRPLHDKILIKRVTADEGMSLQESQRFDRSAPDFAVGVLQQG